VPSGPSKTRMSTPNRIALALVLAALLAVIAVVTSININRSSNQAALAQSAQIIQSDSHRLSEAENEKAVLVEFLDFECESCRAAYPFIEELRARHTDELTVVSRYFPLPGHPNSMTAAVAVEAAARQGKFEDMYHRMFETQPQWSHSEDSQTDTFRRYAEELGLDTAAYDAAVADPATAARVERDRNDGTGLGVTGTPTFFLDGQLIAPSTLEEFEQLVTDAIAD
jgi:protein-disulfide isomerase